MKNLNSEENLLASIIEDKRQRWIADGCTEREAEKRIQNYLDWRLRKVEWDELEECNQNCRFCTEYPVRWTKEHIPMCYSCYMTQLICLVPGCRLFVSPVPHSLTCPMHSAELRKKGVNNVGENKSSNTEEPGNQ